jgi:hypothetical protein
MIVMNLAKQFHVILHGGCSFENAYGMAIQALEKQMPKKVVRDGKWIYKCPCCGECAETDCGDVFYDYRLDYCNGCGQRLDWSDEE